MGSAKVCSCCKEKIGGQSYGHSGKNYCYNCYQIVQAQSLQEQDDRDKLYDYIRQEFNITDIPDDVISIIDYELKNGKKIQGIGYTIYYYIRILGKTGTQITSLPFIIKNFYAEAKKYRDKIKDITEKNKLINIDTEAVNITLSRDSLQKRKRQLTDISSIK